MQINIEGSIGILENPFLKFNSNRIDSGYSTPNLLNNKSGSKKQEIDSQKILQILCQLPLGYNTPSNDSTQKAVKEIKSEESTLVEKRVIIDTGIFDHPILLQIDNDISEEDTIEEQEQARIVIDTGIFDRPILIQDTEIIEKDAKAVKVKKEEVVRPIIIDTGIFDRPILIQNVEHKDNVANEILIPDIRADTGLWWLYAKPEVIVIEEVQEVKPIIIDTGIFDRPILIQNNEQAVVKEAVEEVKPIIIDTGIFDRPILIQNNEQEPEVIVKEIIIEDPVIEEPIIEDPVPEIRADTGLWWLYAKSEVAEIEEVQEIKPIIIDTGIFDRPILIQNTEQPVVEQPVVEEIKPIIIDTGIFDRPILIQNVEKEPEVITREIIIEEPIVEEQVPEIRGDTGLWWLYAKPEVAEIEEVQEVKPIIIDTGIFDRPILIQNTEQPVVEQAVIEKVKPIIIDTGIFDRPILIQNTEQEPEVITREIIIEEPIVEASAPEIRGDTGLWWLYAKPEVMEVEEEKGTETTRVVIDTGIFDRPILIQNVEQPEVNNREVVVEEESVPETTTRIIIDTGIFDRPILIQKPNKVVEVVKEITGTIIDTGIFDRPIYIQEVPADVDVIINNTREAPNVTPNKDVDYELRGDTGLWWLFYKQDNTNVIEIKRDVMIQPINYLNVNHKLPLGYKVKPWAPRSSCVIQPLIKLPLGVDYLFEPKVETTTERSVEEIVVSSPKETPVISNNEYHVLNVNHRLPLGYNVRWAPKNDVLNVNHKLPLGYKVEPWAPRSSYIIQPLIKLPLGVDYLFEPKVEATTERNAKEIVVSSSKEAPVTSNSDSNYLFEPNAKTNTETERDSLTNMLREIRTPMNSVLGNTEHLLATELNSVQKEYIDNIRSSGNLILNILNNILDYQQIESQKMSLKETPVEVDTLKAKMGKMNTNIAVLSLAFNDAVSDLKQTIKEKDQKIDSLQLSNAKINGQLANLTLNVDETIRNIKNETVPVEIEATPREVEISPFTPAMEVTSRSIDISPVQVTNDKSDELKAKMAQINTQLAKLTLTTNDEVQTLTKDNRAKTNEIEKLRNKLGQLNTQVAVLSLRVNEVEKTNIEMEKNNNKIINDLRNKLAEINGNLAKVTVNSNEEIQRIKKIIKDYDNTLDNLRTKAAEINGNLAKVTVNSNEEIQRIKKITKDYDNTLDDLRAKAAKINTLLAVTTLESNDTINKLKKAIKEDENTIESLRNKAAEINTNLAIVSLNTPSNAISFIPQNDDVEIQSREVTIPEVPTPIIIDVASDKEDSLRAKAADINTRLALVTLKYDNDIRTLKKIQKQKDAVIEDLRNKAAALNTNLAILTLDTNEESACLKEIAVEKQLEVEALRSNASQLNSQLANLTLNLDEILRSNNAYLNDKAEEVEFLRQCTVQLNKQLAQLTLSFDEILKNNNGYMIKQQEEIDNLNKKTTELNGRLARLTLNYDELNHSSQKQSKKQEETIEKLQQKAAQLNGSIAKLTLTFDEMMKQKMATPVINVTPEPEVITREVVINEVASLESKDDKFRDVAVRLNQNLATLTLDYDKLKKESEAQQKVNLDKIDLLQKERCKINNNLARVTLQYDEDMIKKNRAIKNYKNKLSATNIAYNNARRGSIVAKIQKIERLTDISTNLNGNLAKVTLEFNEMVQSKDAEINKLKNTLKKYENVNERRASTITVECNDANYYNINSNSDKKINKEMGTPTDFIVSTKEVPEVPPAAEPEVKEVTTTKVVTKTEVEDTNGKKNKKKGKSKSSSKKNKAIVKKSTKYTDLTIEQRKAMNKEIVNQSCTIL